MGELRIIRPFAMEEVVNDNVYCTNALNKEIKYLLAFDTDRLLAGFRENARLDTKGKARYDGWENMLIGGHTMGHYLTALAQAYCNPGVDNESKDRINRMIDGIVEGLFQCQEHSQGKPGFIFGATIADKDNVESQFDCVEEKKTDIFKEAWVPWYTMHKILAGLIECYKLTKKDKALVIAKRLGNWVYNRTDSWDEERKNIVLETEYGGMNDCLYELYAITKDERYAMAAHRFDEVSLFEKVMEGKKDTLCNIHANTTIPKFMGALNRYDKCHGDMIGGEKVDASRYLEYAKSFWTMVMERHTYVTGGNSEWEHFREDYKLDMKRTNCNCETCNVHNMLKFSRLLFQITGEKKYADYYEQAYINAILPSQNPETGMSMYFQPMATGYFKVFSRPWDNFWCCTGTGMENFTKLNDGILFHDERYIYVNIYTDAMLTWQQSGLKLSIRADFLQSDEVNIRMSEIENSYKDVTTQGKYGLALRIPDWADGEVKVSIDGDFVTMPQIHDGYIYLDYEDIAKKAINVKLPMRVTANKLPDNPDMVAFKYGPYVLSANLGTKDMNQGETGVNVTIPESRVEMYDDIVLPDTIDKTEFADNPTQYFDIRRSDAGLSLVLTLNKLEFVPHYKRYKERYGLYFRIVG